jgi:hypothetical protein
MDHPATPIRGRLVKVWLPSEVVRGMDEIIESTGLYTDRSEFIADAVAGHIAELRSGQDSPSRPAEAEVNSWAASEPFKILPSVPMSALLPIHGSISTLETSGGTASEPTWGMHNRDFPTLWALWHLARAVDDTGGPVAFEDWLSTVRMFAWEMSRRLPRDRYDTSGFPSNPNKREASEGRFIRFFVGTEPGRGPLFSLGLAATTGNRVAPSPAGLELLQVLEGFSCERASPVHPNWAGAFLRHLGRHVPSDFDFMSEILVHIASGRSNRIELLEAVSAEHPAWSEAVAGTNVAGFIARAREWGLVSPRQVEGKYLLQPLAVDQVAAVASTLRAHV